MSKLLEEWKDIKGYEGLYQVNSEGRIKSLVRKTPFRKSFITIKERILKAIDDKDGYLVVNLYKEGKKKMRKIHRLVAEAFIPNPYNFTEINHKDEDKTNNNVVNLEWCTNEYNLNYGSRNVRASQASTNGKKSKQVYQYTLDGKLVAVWPSVAECGRNGYDKGGVSACCNGKLNTYLSYKWSYNTINSGQTPL